MAGEVKLIMKSQAAWSPESIRITAAFLGGAHLRCDSNLVCVRDYLDYPAALRRCVGEGRDDYTEIWQYGAVCGEWW